MNADDATLAGLEGRFEQDGIAYLLIQFVDIHGSAKVKLVPARALRDVVESGAGFAGGAVWGMGQGPALARHDGPRRSRDLHADALRARRGAVRRRPVRRRSAASVLPARQPEADARRAPPSRVTSSTSGSSPSSSW